MFFCGQISSNLQRGWARDSTAPGRHSLQVGAVPPGTAAFGPTEGVGEQSAENYTRRKEENDCQRRQRDRFQLSK